MFSPSVQIVSFEAGVHICDTAYACREQKIANCILLQSQFHVAIFIMYYEDQEFKKQTELCMDGKMVNAMNNP